MRTPARFLIASAIGAALLSSLTGCFLLPETPSAHATHDVDDERQDEANPTGSAAVGDCWEAEAVDLSEWSTWKGDGPVDCDDVHQTYTYFAGELKGDIDEGWDHGSITTELADSVTAQCDVNLRKLGISIDAQRVSLYFFVAPEEEWHDGDRRIRCDLAVTAIDSDWYDLELEDLPDDISDLIDDVDRNPISYEFCLIGDGFGPYESSEAYVADCEDDYYWRFAEGVYIDELAEGPYPSDDELQAFAEDACPASGARDGEELLFYVPSEEMWDDHYTYVDCWYSLLEAPSEPV